MIIKTKEFQLFKKLIGKKTAREISKELGVSIPTLTLWAKKLGLKRVPALTKKDLFLKAKQLVVENKLSKQKACKLVGITYQTYFNYSKVETANPLLQYQGIFKGKIDLTTEEYLKIRKNTLTIL